MACLWAGINPVVRAAPQAGVVGGRLQSQQTETAQVENDLKQHGLALGIQPRGGGFLPAKHRLCGGPGGVPC